jgi:uncharacterized protein YbjT (DUF2867 family)
LAEVERIAADAHDERAVEAAVAGADGVVNAVSLYVERGSETFRSVHVEAAARIASAARRTGVLRLVHLSGIGADAASSSAYIRSRGEGEAAVQAAFPAAVIIRPGVMFAPDDGFLTTILGLLHQLASRQAVAGIRPSRAPSCSRTGSRSPSIASRKTERANSSGFTVVLPIDLSVSHASSNAVSSTTSV